MRILNGMEILPPVVRLTELDCCFYGTVTFNSIVEHAFSLCFYRTSAPIFLRLTKASVAEFIDGLRVTAGFRHYDVLPHCF